MTKPKPKTGRPWTVAERHQLAEMASNGLSPTKIGYRLHRTNADITDELARSGIVIDTSANGTERRCMNWNSIERPCRQTFTGKHAGPCPSCRRSASATPFELPARLL